MCSRYGIPDWVGVANAECRRKSYSIKLDNGADRYARN